MDIAGYIKGSTQLLNLYLACLAKPNYNPWLLRY